MESRRLIVGTKKIDKEFLWLQAVHIIDDMRESKEPKERNIHKILKKLNSTFFIKKRKTKNKKTENTFNGKKMTKKQSEQLGIALKNPNVKFEYADKVIIETRPFKKNK